MTLHIPRFVLKPCVFYAVLSLVVCCMLQRLCAFDYYYAEQYRLFRWSADYVLPFLVRAGGPMSLVVGFFMQFYVLPWVGAVVSALMFFLMALGTHRLLGRIAPSLPLPAFGIAAGLMQCALATEIHYYLEQSWALIAAVWLLQGIAALMPRRCEVWARLALRVAGIVTLLASLYYIAGPVVWADFYYPSMLHASEHSYWPLLSVATGLVVAFVLMRRKTLAARAKYALIAVQLVIAFGIGGWYFTRCHNAEGTLVKELDYYRNHAMWDAILAVPDLPSSQVPIYANYQNLALAAKGCLAEEFMQHGQTGPTGLQQVWQGLQFESDLLSDIFMVQGHVAMAQKMAFIAMQYNADLMHGRLMLRLIETNLILKEDRVAEKYICLLEQTYAYAERAREYRKFVGHPELVSADPYLGELQRCTEGCDIATNDLVDGLLQICRANPEHKAAFDYLGAYFIMSNDLEGFRRFLDDFSGAPALQPLPACFKMAADHIGWSSVSSTLSNPEH